jgi:hypothetical protein
MTRYSTRESGGCPLVSPAALPRFTTCTHFTRSLSLGAKKITHDRPRILSPGTPFSIPKAPPQLAWKGAQNPNFWRTIFRDPTRPNFDLLGTAPNRIATYVQ